MSENTMCPPPPPLPLFNAATTGSVDRQNIGTAKQIFPILNTSNLACPWSSKYTELQKTCQRFAFCINNQPFNYTYKHFESLLQVGPTCGLVAISMLLQKKISPLELLEKAREQKYSNNGELFSVKSAHSLLKSTLTAFEDMNIKAEVVQANLFSPDVISSLLAGCIALVPYDSDRNHSPCLKTGHKAHWALVTGIIIVDEPDTQNQYHPDSVYVTAKHGKSLHVALWRLKDLQESNLNLTEFSPDRECDDKLEYVVPEGGLGGEAGLKGQFILIEPFE